MSDESASYRISRYVLNQVTDSQSWDLHVGDYLIVERTDLRHYRVVARTPNELEMQALLKFHSTDSRLNKLYVLQLKGEL